MWLVVGMAERTDILGVFCCPGSQALLVRETGVQSFYRNATGGHLGGDAVPFREGGRTALRDV
jgi:hypothetical protein